VIGQLLHSSKVFNYFIIISKISNASSVLISKYMMLAQKPRTIFIPI
jgi:hypothetical protein